MASIAKHRDDVAGAIVTGGTATAYTVTSYEAFDTPTRLNGQIIAFTPHVTNGSTVTLNVELVGGKAFAISAVDGIARRDTDPGDAVFAVYNNLDAVFYLRSFTAILITCHWGRDWIIGERPRLIVRS